MVSQKTWLVEWYQLHKHGVWGHTALAEAVDAAFIPKLDLTLTLAEIYDEVSVVPMKVGSATEEK
ncbi:MAG: hypothetical protein ACRYFZ_11565 [Janthinobacterium lividum]